MTKRKAGEAAGAWFAEAHQYSTANPVLRAIGTIVRRKPSVFVDRLMASDKAALYGTGEPYRSA
jgi:hypothetical protein